MPERNVRARIDGYAGFLRKPFQLAELEQLVAMSRMSRITATMPLTDHSGWRLNHCRPCRNPAVARDPTVAATSRASRVMLGMDPC